MTLSADDASITLLKAQNRAIDERLYQQWVVYSQLEQSFNDFKESCKSKAPRSSKSIMKDVYGYIELFNQGMTKVET